MSILRNLESKLEGLFEGAFNRTFKSKVQPVEIARKLAKEMQDNKTVSIKRTYVPNQYLVYLSEQDRVQFEGYEEGVLKELSDYLLEHARDEGLALITRPTVEFRTDDRLGLGEFGIQAMLVRPPEDEHSEPEEADFGHTMVYSVDREPQRLEVPPVAEGRAMLVGGGRRTVLAGNRFLIGRSRDSDLMLDDPNVSRRHAELRKEHGAWLVADLGSTNGVKVNGRRVAEQPLNPGDEITVGLEKLHFEVDKVDDPIAVMLKFGFLAVLYLFLLWIARSALRDVSGGQATALLDDTGPTARPRGGMDLRSGVFPQLEVVAALGRDPGERVDVNDGITLGRSPTADLQIDDPFASSAHARIFLRGEFMYIEDMGSTNGTFLNGRQLRKPEQLKVADSIRIGDTEYRYQE